jgi:ATP-binding cassette subfamily B protein
VTEFIPPNRFSQFQKLQQALYRLPPLLWETDARLTSWLTALQCCQTVIPVAQLWVVKLIVDRLVRALRSPHPSQAAPEILGLVILEFGLAVIGLLLREGAIFSRTLLAERLTVHVSGRILEHAQALDLELLERPEFYDRLRRAEESALHRPAGLLFRLLDVLQGGVTLLLLAAVLVRLNPLAVPLLVLAAIPYALVHSRAAIDQYSLSTAQTPAARRAYYLSRLLSTDTAAKEIRVFGLGTFLLDRYRRILQGHEQELRALAARYAGRSALAGLLPSAAYAVIFAYFCLQALDGHITVGDLTLYTGIVLRSQDVLQQTLFGLSGIVEQGLFLDDYRAFLTLQPVRPVETGGRPPPSPISRGVCFEGVGYRYAAGRTDALHDTWIELPAGETVAIVGENGAGKTTLVKLLARLYDPTAGRITVDGVDLRTIDALAWRRQIAVVFQDFAQYYFTAAENIGLGWVESLEDRQRIIAAAERGGADAIIDRLPRGYDTVLGSWFEEGAQLSGGEWQRLALARAFMRDAPILVLDEPTAGLDARAEYELFRRFRELAHGRTVLLISHRFSTVRMADRIYVLEAGHVVESGSHEELLACGGRYAELFHLQATGYR